MNMVFEKRVLLEPTDAHILELLEEEDGYDRSLFVNGIPLGTTEIEMREVFAVAGALVNFKIAIDRDASNPIMAGKATYADKKTAKQALVMFRNFEFKGRKLLVIMMTPLAILAGKHPIHWDGDMPAGTEAVANAVCPPIDEQTRKLNEKLLALPEDQLSQLNIPPRIRNAILRRQKDLVEHQKRQEAQRITDQTNAATVSTDIQL